MMEDDVSEDNYDLVTKRFNDTYMEELGAEKENKGQRADNDIKILIASDIHIGYGENKPVISNDSINTFEEVLQIAVRESVDMVLLGGDLFHENNPSRDMMCKVVRLLRKYCLSDRDVLLEFVSDPSVNFKHSNFDRVNYEDMNLNIGLPIFTIHGNHDDMAAKGLTALDELHESGLINLFGKFEECESYEVSPVLLRKGDTRLALYGIGSQRDDRLTRSFESATIKFLRPLANADEWFNILTVHQNRPPRNLSRSTGSYLPVKYIPSFFDIVLWGHEHECRIDPEYVEVNADMTGDGFFVIQPGSTVATSLTVDEAKQKHVSVLTVRGRRFQSRPIPLQTTRKIYVEKLEFNSVPEGFRLPTNGCRPVEVSSMLLDEYLCKERMRELIKRSKAERGPRQPELPLVRLNLVYSGPWLHMSPMPTHVLSAAFANEIANPGSVVNVKKQKDKRQKASSDAKGRDHGHFSALDPCNMSVQDMVSAYYSRAPFEEKLTIMTDQSIKNALHSYVNDGAAVARSNDRLDDAFTMKMDHAVKALLRMYKSRHSKESDCRHLSEEDIESSIELDLMALKKLTYKEDNLDKKKPEKRAEKDGQSI